MPMNLRIFALMIFTSWASCKAEDEKVFQKEMGNQEEKPKVVFQPDGNAATATPIKKKAEVNYALKISSRSGAVLCRGEVNLIINSNFSMTSENSRAQCGAWKLDLGSLFAGGIGIDGGSGGIGEKKEMPIEHDGYVLKVKKLSNALFEPGRPLILGPIITDNSKYRNFNRSYQSTVQSRNKSGSGTFDVEVLDHETSYSNSKLKENGHEPFSKIIHWKITASGFDGFGGSDGLIFDEMQWKWNTSPIMIPEIRLKGDMQELLGSDSQQQGDDVIGIVEIIIAAKDYTIFK